MCQSVAEIYIIIYIMQFYLFINKHTWADSFRCVFFIHSSFLFACVSDVCAVYVCLRTRVPAFLSLCLFFLKFVACFACIWTITCFKLTHPYTKTDFFGYMKIFVEYDRFAACLFWPLKYDDHGCKNTIREWKHKEHKTIPIQQLENRNSLSNKEKEYFFRFCFQWWTKRTLKFRLKTATCDFRRIVLEIEEKETNECTTIYL